MDSCIWVIIELSGSIYIISIRVFRELYSSSMVSSCYCSHDPTLSITGRVLVLLLISVPYLIFFGGDILSGLFAVIFYSGGRGGGVLKEVGADEFS